MATANPEEADITCKNPDCPKGTFQWKTILKHIGHAKKCRNFYSEAEIGSMREHSKGLQMHQKAKRKRNNYNPGQDSLEPVASTSGNTNQKATKLEKIKSQCNTCKKSFAVLLTHLNQSTNCKKKIWQRI